MVDNRLPHEKGFHVSWDQIHRDSRALAWRLDGKGPNDGGWKAVVAITRGGLAPAMIVARELDIRTVDTISVKSYNHQTQTEPVVIKSPDMDVCGDGTGVLVVDDLVDSGKTLELVRSDPFPFEGWGLTAMDGMLVASDGSATLRFLDPETYAVEHEVTVTLDGRPIARLNELEAADGLIWANQWYSQVIVGIDPADGTIRRIVDLSPLVAEIDAAQNGAVRNGAVLNGIAHDPASDRWFVTGKLWPTMFEVRLVPREAEPDASATGG